MQWRKSALVVVILMVFGLSGTSHARYDFNHLFEFSRDWQQPADQSDLLRLLERWHTELPTPTPSPTPTLSPTPAETPKTILLPGDVPLVLVHIPAGTFEMGSDTDSTEQPAHAVTMGHDFYLGKYEVTQAQWEAVMEATPAQGHGVGDDYPVYFVSWNNSQAFIEALTALNLLGEGTFRLPSEAEWEYACRAGTTTSFYFGDSDCSPTGCGPCELDSYAWWCGNNIPFETSPVGQLLPNAFGLYDMHGNVREWCQDDWHDNYNEAPVDGSAWEDEPRSAYRVHRGGSWGDEARDCRSSCRSKNLYDYPLGSVGLRLVWTP